MPDVEATYELFYWPQIPGRGEFVRLLLEEVGVDYVDVGRLSEDEGGGRGAVAGVLDTDGAQPPRFAPPVLRHGDDDLVVSQTSNICLYLARRHGLVPETERDRLHANQLQLTLQDLLREVHDTHHPISVAEYYEDQKEAALERATFFREERMPKYLEYFESASRVPEGSDCHLLGDGFSYVDLSMFQMLRGLDYAFPEAFDRHTSETPRLLELEEAVAEREGVGRYLASDRRIGFSEKGIFRHYPELDG